jgi:superfamily II DNA/RNA helicase
LHGDLNQSVRNKTLEDFKSGDNLILVASDVAARGIDVENLNLVINFDVPVNSEDYVHRIGRTGRAGNTGMAVTFVTNAEKRKLKGISKLIQQDIPEMPLVLDEEKPKEKPIRQERLWDDAPVPLKPIVGFGDFVPAFMLRPAFPTT